jgi:hypothetical protein
VQEVLTSKQTKEKDIIRVNLTLKCLIGSALVAGCKVLLNAFLGPKHWK